MKLRNLALAVCLLAPTSAFALVEPITGFDTTSSQDYAMRSRGLSLSSHTFELTARAQWLLLDGPNVFALRPGFTFGVTSDFELGAEAIIQLEPGSEVLFAPRLVYSIIDSASVDVALTGLLILDFDNDGGESVLPMRQFGVPVRIKLLDNLSIFTGNNAVSWQRVGGEDYIDINFNVGLGYQFRPDMAFRFDTQLFALNVTGPRDSTSIGDIFPLGFGWIYAIGSRVDVTAGATYYAVDGGGDFLALDGGLLARF